MGLTPPAGTGRVVLLMEKIDIVLEKLESIENRISALEDEIPKLTGFLGSGFMGLAAGLRWEEIRDLLKESDANVENALRLRDQQTPS